MDYGRLNTPISFVKKSNTKDPISRENTTTLERLFITWAERRDQKLREKLSTAGTVLEDSLTYVIRYQQVSTISNAMHVQDHLTNELYQVIDILPNEQDKDLINVFVKKVS